MLFGTWRRDKTFPADDGRSTHKDYSDARFQRHLQAVSDVTAFGTTCGLSCPQLCIGVLLRTPGVAGCIVGARNAFQGAMITSLAAQMTDDQAKVVWDIADKLRHDLEHIQ